MNKPIATLLAVAVLAACSKSEGVNPESILIAWEPVTQLVDGSPLPAADASYTVWEMDSQVLVCDTTDTSCTWNLVQWGVCYTFGATATDNRTGLTSVMSDLVTWCAPDGAPSHPNKPEKVRAGNK